MISTVRGVVQQLGASHVVIDLNGLGFKVLSTPQTVGDLRLGQEATLFTSLVVREDSLTLYGFATDSARDLFELAQTASGVGPKVALSIASVFDADEFAQAVRGERVSALTKVPGIGPKGAQKIILELKDKVNALSVPVEAPATAEPWRDQVAAGLEGLGWSSKDAQAACERVSGLAASDPNLSIAVLMRAALRSLAKV